jgi:hypothetical protein
MQYLLRLLLLTLAAFLGSLFASPERRPSAGKPHRMIFFSETLKDAGENGPSAREQCRINDWLNYDTTPGCTDAARRADNVADGLRLRNQLAGQEIAGGHAFGMHAAEFGFKSPAQMASQVESVMTNPSAVRNMSRGRTAY